MKKVVLVFLFGIIFLFGCVKEPVGKATSAINCDDYGFTEKEMADLEQKLEAVATEAKTFFPSDTCPLEYEIELTATKEVFADGQSEITYEIVTNGSYEKIIDETTGECQTIQNQELKEGHYRKEGTSTSAAVCTFTSTATMGGVLEGNCPCS